MEMLRMSRPLPCFVCLVSKNLVTELPFVVRVVTWRVKLGFRGCQCWGSEAACVLLLEWRKQWSGWKRRGHALLEGIFAGKFSRITMWRHLEIFLQDQLENESTDIKKVTRSSLRKLLPISTTYAPPLPSRVSRRKFKIMRFRPLFAYFMSSWWCNVEVWYFCHRTKIGAKSATTRWGNTDVLI